MRQMPFFGALAAQGAKPTVGEGTNQRISKFSASIPRYSKRVTLSQALLVCKVDSTRRPVNDGLNSDSGCFLIADLDNHGDVRIDL